jgi:L-seryl-tRNA(Ser) seleniumtransferase
VRADKVTLAAMQYVALAYLTGTAAALPLWRMATVSNGELRARASAIVERNGNASVIGTEAVAGGGSLPGLTIPSVGVALHVANPQVAQASLREWGVIARIERDAVVCDLRTVDPTDDARVADALAAIA